LYSDNLKSCSFAYGHFFGWELNIDDSCRVPSEVREVLRPVDGVVKSQWAGAESGEDFNDEVESDDGVEYYDREENDIVKNISDQVLDFGFFVIL